jgi:hypothetical protein
MREPGKRLGRFRRKPLLGLVAGLFLAGLSPAGLKAQVAPLNPQGTPQPAVYGGGIQTPLLFEGETTPSNKASLSLGVAALYDDNVFTRNIQRVGDEALTFNPDFNYSKRSDRLVLGFDYAPSFIGYRQISEFDRVNQGGGLGMTYTLTPHLLLSLHDSITYQTGNYPLFGQAPTNSGPPAATGIESQILPYSNRVLTNSAGLDLTYVKSQRTSLTFSAGYNLLKYKVQAGQQPLYNGNGLSGSLLFQYRLTEHSLLGALLIHQDNTYQGGKYFGSRLRSQIESAYLSFGSLITPSVSVTFFGGPQYVGTVGQVSTNAGVAAHFQGSGGASVTKQLRRTAFDLAVRRSVSGSGGLYTSVVSTDATLAFRRRLVEHWEIDCHAGAGKQDASLFKLANGTTEGLSGGIRISRLFSAYSEFYISYDTWHQLSKGTLPIFSHFDRNIVQAGVNYQLKALHLGR